MSNSQRSSWEEKSKSLSLFPALSMYPAVNTHLRSLGTCSGKTITTRLMCQASHRNTNWIIMIWKSALCQKQTVGCITVQQLCSLWLTVGRKQSDREPLWKCQVNTGGWFSMTPSHPSANMLHISLSGCCCLFKKNCDFYPERGLNVRQALLLTLLVLLTVYSLLVLGIIICIKVQLKL